MLISNSYGLRGLFHGNSISQITNGGRFPTEAEPLELFNLPGKDIVVPFGFVPTGSITTITKLNNHNEAVTDIIQWGADNAPLAIRQSIGQIDPVILRSDADIQNYIKANGFNDGLDRSVFATVMSYIVEPLPEEHMVQFFKMFPDAKFYGPDFKEERENLKSDGFYDININAETMDAVTATANVILKAMDQMDNTWVEKISQKISSVAANETIANRIETYKKLIEAIKARKIETTLNDFSVPFSPSSFNALSNISDVPETNFEKYQIFVADKLPQFKDAFVRTEMGGLLSVYSAQMENIGIDSSIYFESQSFKAAEKYAQEPETVQKINERIVALQFQLKDLKKAELSELDKETKTKEIEESLLVQKERFVALFGKEATSELSMSVLKDEVSFKYKEVVTGLALLDQKKHGMDYNTLVLNSNKPDEMLQMMHTTRLPYRAAQNLISNPSHKRAPHNSAIKTLTRSTLYAKKTTHSDNTASYELKEGQRIDPVMILTKNYALGIRLNQSFHEKIATSIQYLSTLTAKGYKQEHINPMTNEMELEIKDDTRKRVETIIAVLDEVSDKTNPAVLDAIKSFSTTLKEALLLEGEKLNAQVKKIIKDENAVYAPIVSAAMNTDVVALYEANRIARFTEKHPKEVSQIVSSIYEGLTNGTIGNDTAAISFVATGDEKRDYKNAATAVSLYKDVIATIYAHSYICGQLEEEGKKEVRSGKELTANALMYKAPSIKVLSAVSSIVGAAVQNKVERYQSTFIPKINTKTTQEVEKTFNVSLPGGDTVAKKFVTIEPKPQNLMNVILGKMKSAFNQVMDAVSPEINNIVNNKIRRRDRVVANGIRQMLDGQTNISEAVYEKLNEDIVKEEKVEQLEIPQEDRNLQRLEEIEAAVTEEIQELEEYATHVPETIDAVIEEANDLFAQFEILGGITPEEDESKTVDIIVDEEQSLGQTSIVVPRIG